MSDNMNFVTDPIKKVASTTLSIAADKFINFILMKYTGKTIKVIEAEADVEADKIKSRWELLEKPLWIQMEAAKLNRDYSNLGNTLLKSTKYINSEETRITDQDDFFWGLLEYSKEISNDEVQEVIAKIIAGEYNSPNTYSRSTLQVLKQLGKAELELLEKFSAIMINGGEFLGNFFDLSEEKVKIRQEENLDYESFVELQNLNLISENTIVKKIITEKSSLSFDLKYQGETLKFSTSEGLKTLETPAVYKLTIAGKQIMQHLKPRRSEQFVHWLKDYYKSLGLKIETI